jgi:hypothetical protein
MNQALGTYQLPAFSIIYGLEYTVGGPEDIFSNEDYSLVDVN